MNYGMDFTAFMIILSMILGPIREHGKERRGDPGTGRHGENGMEKTKRGDAGKRKQGKGDRETRKKTRRKENADTRKPDHSLVSPFSPSRQF
jgi:hypothetical protein